MWIVYRTDNFNVVSKCYSKKAAKLWVEKYYKDWRKNFVTVEIAKVDLMHIDKWLSWKILST